MLSVFNTNCIFFSYPSLLFIFLFLFPFSWLDACVCLFQIPVQSWSLNYGKPRRPFRPSEPTWQRLQVVYLKFFLRLFLLWQCRSSWDIFKCKVVKCYLYFLPPEHEVPLQERKNYKSSPEIQVGEWQIQKYLPHKMVAYVLKEEKLTVFYLVLPPGANQTSWKESSKLLSQWVFTEE